MAEYGGWVTLGDSSPKPPEKSGSWLKPIHLTKSELLPIKLVIDIRDLRRQLGVRRRFAKGCSTADVYVKRA